MNPCSICNVESINRYPEYFNLGGIEKIEFAPTDDIVSIPEADHDNKVTGPVIFAVGKSWLTLECTEGTMDYNWTEEDTDHGELVTSIITGEIPKTNQTAESKLLFTARKKFIVRFKDNNGFYRIAGTLINPVRLSKKGTTGLKSNNKNMISISLRWQSIAPASFYKDLGISIPNEYSS